jgi:hypothetical protein
MAFASPPDTPGIVVRTVEVEDHTRGLTRRAADAPLVGELSGELQTPVFRQSASDVPFRKRSREQIVGVLEDDTQH